MTQATIESLREVLERLGAFTAVVTDALEGNPHQATVAQVSNEVIAKANKATDALAVEPME